MVYLKPFVIPFLLLCLWAGLSALDAVNRYLVPPPTEVWKSAIDLLQEGDLQRHILASVRRVLLGFFTTSIIAIPLAVLLYFYRLTEGYLRFILEFMRNTPPLAAIPLLILWFGIGEASKLAVIILASFFPIFLSALSGLRSVDRRLMEMADTLELTGIEKLRFVLIPGALPPIVTGLRLGFGYSWRALIGAELIAASVGLGYMILDAQELARTDTVFVGIAVIGALGYVFDLIFLRLIRHFFFYANLGDQL
jgi:sulfonate transport system permease protein